MKRVLIAAAIAVAFILSSRTASAAPIQYVATDLGGGLWQYDYYLGSNTFSTQEGFTVYFSDDYANLQLVGTTPDWFPLVTDFDPALSSFGTYDALALVDNPAFAGPFSVKFAWSGAGAPGSQPYELYALDVSGFPDPFERGMTVPRVIDENPAPVPEPSTLLLMATGGLAAARRLKHRRRSSS